MSASVHSITTYWSNFADKWVHSHVWGQLYNLDLRAVELSTWTLGLSSTHCGKWVASGIRVSVGAWWGLLQGSMSFVHAKTVSFLHTVTPLVSQTRLAFVACSWKTAVYRARGRCYGIFCELVGLRRRVHTLWDVCWTGGCNASEQTYFRSCTPWGVYISRVYLLTP